VTRRVHYSGIRNIVDNVSLSIYFMEGGGFGEPCVIAVFSISLCWKSNRSCNGVIDDDAFGLVFGGSSSTSCLWSLFEKKVPVIQS
jgi:hypothetical protein